MSTSAVVVHDAIELTEREQREKESASTALVRRDDANAGLAPMTFAELIAMGNELVKTGFLPAHVKTGAQAAAIMLTGRELGMPPMRALRSLVMVKGKVTENADSQLDRFKMQGGRAAFVELTDTRAVLKLRHPNGDEFVETFTIADAERAGLLASDNSNWRKYPKQMLRSRAITSGLKSLGWGGSAGNYDPDELAFDAAPLSTASDEPAYDDETSQHAQHEQNAAPVVSDTPACPQCGNAMWDNRATKKNPKAPDFKCKDRNCAGVIWPPKEGEQSAISATSADPYATLAFAPWNGRAMHDESVAFNAAVASHWWLRGKEERFPGLVERMWAEVLRRTKSVDLDSDALKHAIEWITNKKYPERLAVYDAIIETINLREAARDAEYDEHERGAAGSEVVQQ